ncbi:Metallo-dependent phosphatase-like protein [Crepidotus variabilis]|uniref:Metallo-dependent phosphatase-like protein n=1 Tax=Crepidotus variabilis TaxID=179855 RepID=A0A9P6ENI8_9AGAR|nr:Metallo-dependent phosphatase-like protein [Crepidotus variabilis]
MTSTLSILHFNDVYRVTPQKFSSKPNETIDVTQFAALVDDLRDKWPHSNDGKKDGLLLFSGDVFSPSVESSVTRGSHMVPVLNSFGIDVSLTGNHDFDFGYPHLTNLIKDTNFPWLLSNIIDTRTSTVPKHVLEYLVLERAGLRIGFIGLVEEAWITTVSSWPKEFIYQSMKDTGLRLSKELRDPNGQHKCDLIIALTHSRVPNDIILAKELFALTPSSQSKKPITGQHGVDMILGGHDHLYFVGKGCDSWDKFDKDKEVLGAEGDEGDVLVIKSGSDFRDLSEITLELSPSPDGSIRNKVINKITGKRHEVLPGSRSSKPLADLLKTLLKSIGSTLKAPVCELTCMVDVRSGYIRLEESAICDWFSDIVRHAYDDALCMKGCEGSDGVLLCAGTFRGDSTYGPGPMTMGDILEILPFEDPIVVIRIDGGSLWEALEGAFSTWPAQEGRFPTVSGFRVEWDSRKPAGQRVLGLWLLVPDTNGPGVREEEIKREDSGRKYTIVTREYMAQGHDGFDALTKGQWLIDHECGATFSTLVRQYMLGSQFVNKMVRLKSNLESQNLSAKTKSALSALEEDIKARSPAATHWKQAVTKVLQQSQAKMHYRQHFQISTSEHMSIVDAYDGQKARQGLECGTGDADTLKEDLLVITPQTDGRLKDIGRP